MNTYCMSLLLHDIVFSSYELTPVFVCFGVGTKLFAVWDEQTEAAAATITPERTESSIRTKTHTDKGEGLIM